MRSVALLICAVLSFPAHAQMRSKAFLEDDVSSKSSKPFVVEDEFIDGPDNVPVIKRNDPSEPSVKDPSNFPKTKVMKSGRNAPNVRGILPGTILISTSERKLYLGLSKDEVRVYPVAVGRAGAQWKGTAVIGRKASNPTWHPTPRQRKKKNLPVAVKPGPSNPLGARAMYLSMNGKETLFRIHGTNAPSSIGGQVSDGCIRMRNSDVVDLYDRVSRGTIVKVI